MSRSLAEAPIPVFTFVTSDEMYGEMLESFLVAGFNSAEATFCRLTSRSRPGEPEPYSTISELIASVSEPYFILCHQDVRLDQGHGVPQLRAQIESLSATDPRWAVVGNAGGCSELRVIRRITDPHGGSTPDSLPARVQSLDENFLVVRTGTGLACSPGLRGFHLYGTDLCMQARRHGFSSYVVDFHTRHLSGGKRGAATGDYRDCRSRLVETWNPHFRARYVRAPMEVLFFSRWGSARALIGSSWTCRVIRNRAWLGRVIGAVLSRL